MARTVNRILEFRPTDEEAIVSRILVQVHKAVDEAFPGTMQTNRQFTKTVFSDQDAEPTSAANRPGDVLAAAEALGQGEGGDQLPPPPPGQTSGTPTPTAKSDAPQSGQASQHPSQHPSHPSQQGSRPPSMAPDTRNAPVSGYTEEQLAAGADWVTILAGVVFIAGLITLAVIFLK